MAKQSRMKDSAGEGARKESQRKRKNREILRSIRTRERRTRGMLSTLKKRKMKIIYADLNVAQTEKANTQTNRLTYEADAAGGKAGGGRQRGKIRLHERKRRNDL